MQLNLFSCYLLFYLVTLILMNSFESCLDLFNHSKWWCNFEFSIWFSFRKTSKLVNPLVKTCWSISRDYAILKFLFGSLKWFSKDGAIPFESYSVLFDGAMFKLVWWCNFEISIWYSCIRWCNIKYLYLDLSWSISIYLYLDLSQSISILIYPNLYLSWSIKINLDLSWSILIYHNCFDTHL